MENVLEENKIKDNGKKAEDNNDVLINLMQESLKTNQEVLKLSRYIKKYIVWQKIFFWFKFVLVLVPIILAIVYLPPFLRGAFGSFQSLSGSFNSIIENAYPTEGSE